MQDSRCVSLKISRQGQVLTIPPEFALAATEAVLRQEGHRLIIEPISSKSLITLLKTLPDIEDDFLDIDEDLPPLDDVIL